MRLIFPEKPWPEKMPQQARERKKKEAKKKKNCSYLMLVQNWNGGPNISVCFWVLGQSFEGLPWMRWVVLGPPG